MLERTANSAMVARSGAPTLRNMRCTWFFTVCSERFNWAASSLLERPWRINWASCSWRGLKSWPLCRRIPAILFCAATKRNSADDKEGGQTASPAATHRIARHTSAAEASLRTYPSTPSCTIRRKTPSSASMLIIRTLICGLESTKKIREDGHHKLEQSAYNQRRDADDRDRVNQRRFHRRFQPHCFFNVSRQTLQNYVQNTARFTCLNHVSGEIIEDIRVLAHGIGQSGAAFHRGADSGQRLLKCRIFLVGRQNLQTLHQRQSGINHHRELAEKNGDVFHLDFAGAECRHHKFFALFPDCSRCDPLAAQLLSQRLLVRCHAFPGNFLSGSVLAGKCENWHGFNLSSVRR